MDDEVIRLSVVGQILRTRWRLLLVLATIGAVLGASASLVWPPIYQSSSRVLILGEPDKARVISEAQIAMSLVVLDRAAAGLDWGVNGPRLRDSVTSAVVDGNIIEIEAKADSPDRARQLADGVTQQYIAFSTEILTNSANASGEVLAPRKDTLQKEILDTNRRISELQGSPGLLAAATVQGAAARAELQQLNAARTDALKELNELDGRIAKAQAQAAASRANFSVIEPPVAPSPPTAPVRLELVAAGAGLAILLGTVVLVGIRQADRRLRRPADIAAALGAPVLGTVAGPAGTPVSRDEEESPEAVRYRRVLTRLRAATNKPVRLGVVIVDDDVLAFRAADQLASAAAVDGAVALDVVAVSAARPTIPDSPDMSKVLVVVTSGTRTAWQLLAVAEACHDAGHSVAGVLTVLPSIDGDTARNADSARLRLRVGGPA